MHDDSPSIRVSFNKPIPVFPLDDVVLLPHAVLPLHIFEPRYRQMMADALDGAGQIAMATFQGERWREEYHGRPPLRPAVCVGQIARHEKLADGRYNLLLQGVCRARIEQESEADAERMYREARLSPIDDPEQSDEHLSDFRERIHALLQDDVMARFAGPDGESLSRQLIEYIDREEIPTTVVLDLLGHLMVKPAELKYRLLAEPDLEKRARLVEGELTHLRSLLRRAELQIDPEAPKGVRWN